MAVKAFELISVSNLLNISKIESIEISGSSVFIGSVEGLLLHAKIEERKEDSLKSIHLNILCQTVFREKKPISCIKAASAVDRLLVLTDASLNLIDATDLNAVSYGSKVKNVFAVCVNENPTLNDPFALEFCIAKKKCLQVCSLHEAKISILKELATNETPISIAMDGYFICMAGESQYSVVGADTGSVMDIFPLDSSIEYPHIKRISKGEFLLCGPGNLGIFVTAAGTSERPPVHWGDSVCAFAYYDPYILTLTKDFVKVYSVMDQQLKQSIPFFGGLLLGNFDGRIFVTTETSLHYLMSHPMTSQVMRLLEDGNVSEAVELCSYSEAFDLNPVKYRDFAQEVFLRAGFVRFFESRFEEARDYFLKGQLDVCELLSLFPGLLCPSLDFRRAQPPLHSFVDVSQGFQSDAQKIGAAREFLKQYLMMVDVSTETFVNRKALSSAVIKLLAEEEPKSLLDFLSDASAESFEVTTDCLEFLNKSQRFAILAKLHVCLKNYETALELLMKLIRKELIDEHSSVGPSDVVNAILSCGDESVLWKYSDFVVEISPDHAVRLFLEFPADLDRTRVLNRLSRYTRARAKYLEHLVSTCHVEDEGYHTELILYQIGEIQRLLQNQGGTSDGIDGIQDPPKKSLTKPNDVDSTKSKLNDLLNLDRYNAKTVLSRLRCTKLVEETAAVLGKMGNHIEALRILAIELRDFEAALRYCANISSKTANAFGPLQDSPYLVLLKIYLEPNSKSNLDENLSIVLDLLMRCPGDLHLSRVLPLLPSHWSLTVTKRYIKQAMKIASHKKRTDKTRSALLEAVLKQRRFVYDKLCRDFGPIVLTESSVCSTCGDGFTECDFVVYPNGVLVHRSCVKSANVCPLTCLAFKTS